MGMISGLENSGGVLELGDLVDGEVQAEAAVELADGLAFGGLEVPGFLRLRQWMLMR